MAMRYLLVCSNKDGSFVVREEEIEKLIDARQKNQPAIFLEGMVLNWNMYSGLVPAKERLDDMADSRKYGEEMREPSPFAKLLANKLPQLNSRQRSHAQEEGSREMRSLK